MTDRPAYQVLARKYRPETFADLIGQEAMVRTLKNAFAADRIHHAFILTGIRGTGKTTTARIIAKGLNCIGPDGQGKPTTLPCGVCEHCRAIAEGRHVDVQEMDAASRTGVGDIREIIDSVAYRAASARYKVYVIDEVHMLSTSAFNALLKTLEEPPPHVKFIFATTEIRKLPVTVLSRCQRFDLRRIEPEVMMAHLARIASAEGAEVEERALALITRAAEGSVRDAMSLLDQAISHGAGTTGAEQVRAMLGLADRGRVLDLFEAILRGDAPGALAELSSQYADGADPVAVLRDLAEIAHWLSVTKVTPEAGDDPTIPPDERARAADLAGRVAMRVLARFWQMLLKSMEEIAHSPNAMMAAEMAVIRLTHVVDLPAPEELLRRLQDGPPPGGGDNRGAAQGRGATGGPTAMAGSETGAMPAGDPAHPGPVGQGPGRHRPIPSAPRQSGASYSGSATALARAPSPRLEIYQDFDQVIALISEKRDMTLLVDVENHVRLVRYMPGRIEFEPGPDAPGDLAARLAGRLQGWTGARWAVSVIAQGGAPSIAEARMTQEQARAARARAHPLVKAVFEAFPKARIAGFKAPEPVAAIDDAEAAMPPDDWDPFEDD